MRRFTDTADGQFMSDRNDMLLNGAAGTLEHLADGNTFGPFAFLEIRERAEAVREAFRELLDLRERLSVQEAKLTRLREIEIAARSVVEYWKNWPDCCQSLCLESVLNNLRKSLEHGKEKP